MKHTADFTTAAPKYPSWTLADAEADISDVWCEETDPNNEIGEADEVIAYFEDEGDYFYLSGISVADTTDIRFYDRTRAMGFLGADTVDRLERVHGEAS